MTYDVSVSSYAFGYSYFFLTSFFPHRLDKIVRFSLTKNTDWTFAMDKLYVG